MKILAVDTSSAICAVALLENNILINQKVLDNGRTHSENFMPLLDKCLKEMNTLLDDIDLIVCCIGPGSFTGIRIGIASIKAIAEIKNIDIVEVTSLESLAYNVENVEKSTIVSMIDAKNKQVYSGIFDEKYNLKIPYLADDINIVIEKIKDYDNFIFVGDGSIENKEIIIETLKNKKYKFVSENLNKQSAYSAGKCGYDKWINKKDIKSADTLNPLYLRKSQAERLKDAK